MALSGRDVVAISATGSGKTIAFSLPAMIHINAYVIFQFEFPSHLLSFDIFDSFHLITGNPTLLPGMALSP